jgi:hypothetical protein
MTRDVCLTALVVCCTAWSMHAPAHAKHNAPPAGFVALFNGKDLVGWRGLGHVDPRELKAMSAQAREEKQKKDDADLADHWRVDNGEIVNDGQGVYLTTDKDYKDFELLIDWKMANPNSDSGIYLRGCPQVQIWDPNNPRFADRGAPKGSGGLWNNKPGSPGRLPLVRVDRPVGQWNTFRIKMVGDHVTVYFNGQLVVDDAVMHNYFDGSSPLFDSVPIQLQTHDGKIHFRNVFVRKIPSLK